MSDDLLDAETTFNLDEWLSGSVKVTKFVSVYSKPGLQADIDAADAKGDAEEAETLREEMDASRCGFKFRSLSDDRVEAIRKRHKGDDQGAAFAMLAEQCVSPQGVDAEGFRRLAEAIGDGYFAQTILATANAAQQGLGVTVPFSSAASRNRAR